jgi:hypothetical protein
MRLTHLLNMRNMQLLMRDTHSQSTIKAYQRTEGMMKFRGTIEFKNGPAYSYTVEAENEKQARNFALAQARVCGWTEAVKKNVAAPEAVSA